MGYYKPHSKAVNCALVYEPLVMNQTVYQVSHNSMRMYPTSFSELLVCGGSSHTE